MKTEQTPLRILLVDDEPSARRLLKLGLSHDGYNISEVECGASALEAVRRRETDLMVLDLGLPDMGGFEVIKRIRYAKSNIPIIVLSNRDDQAAKVTALDLGADDYVTKPFGVDELLARVRVLQRHRVQAETEQSILRAGELTLDLRRRTATVRGIEVRLSPREYELLRLLAMHAGKVLTHNFILRQVWGTETDVQYIRIYIRALRQKIELTPDVPCLIITEPGVGYRLRASDQRDAVPAMSLAEDAGWPASL